MQTVIAYRGKTTYDARSALAYKVRAFVPKSRRVLDLPCGAGGMRVHLARRGYQMSCADHSEAMRQVTRASLAEQRLGR